MIFDGHIHTSPLQNETPLEAQARLLASMRKAGVDGGTLISLDPLKWGDRFSAKERAELVLAMAAGQETLNTLFWIDPTAPDAIEQADIAKACGVDGFKVICSRFHPSDERAMRTYAHIAAMNKPILFHSGILWDGRPSSKNNRPAEFECLLEIPNLRFCLAHVSWPWCDENIAVYGKFANALVTRSDVSAEMFVDITPGTPPLWREEVFKKLFCGDYDVKHNIIFGTDCNTADYNSDWTKSWLERDGALFDKFGLTADPEFKAHIYEKNVLRFLGKSSEKVQRRLPRVGRSAEDDR